MQWRAEEPKNKVRVLLRWIVIDLYGLEPNEIDSRAANTSFTRIEEWYSRWINYKESEGRWLNMFELQVRPQHASTQNNCNCPLPIYQHGRACSRRITTSCNKNEIWVHLAPIKLSGEEHKSTPSKPTTFSSWFCWVIKAATLTSGKDDGHSGFGAPCHRCVVFVDSRHEKVQRLREKIYEMFIEGSLNRNFRQYGELKSRWKHEH